MLIAAIDAAIIGWFLMFKMSIKKILSNMIQLELHSPTFDKKIALIKVLVQCVKSTILFDF